MSDQDAAMGACVAYLEVAARVLELASEEADAAGLRLLSINIYKAHEAALSYQMQVGANAAPQPPLELELPHDPVRVVR